MTTKIQDWTQLAALLNLLDVNDALSIDELDTELLYDCGIDPNADIDVDPDNYKTTFGKLAIGEKFLSKTGLGVWTKMSGSWASCNYFQTGHIAGDHWKPNNIVWVVEKIIKEQ
ncbi:MAG TPA: hypothetical protein VK203_06145 [Nostocaceae cyanobacterium]|nr:hypothetical protein [Nostocaceae cyanobacterium]